MNKDTLRLIIDIHNYFFRREKRRLDAEDAKDLRVRINSYARPSYASSTVSFYFVTKDNEQVNDTLHCRDYLGDVFREALHELDGSNWSMRRPKPELDELRLLTHSSYLNEENTKAAIRVINMYAKLAGWPKSKVYKARIKNAKEKWIDAYLFVGPKEWQKYPQLLSLFILFIRLAKRKNIPEYITDPYSLECYWAEIIHDEYKKSENRSDDIVTFLSNSYKKLIVLMTNEKEIFGGDLKEVWPARCEHRWGIYSMCLEKSIHPEADQLLHKFYQKEMEKHPKNWR